MMRQDKFNIFLMRLIGFAVLLMFMVPCSLRATTLTDPQYYVGNGFGNSCAKGCAGDPNFIGGTGLDLYILGASGADAPSLLILGIPNFSGAAPNFAKVDELDPTGTVLASTAGSPMFTAGLGGSDSGLIVLGGRGWDPVTGQVAAAGTALYDSANACSVVNGTQSCQDVYNFIGVVPPTDGSNNLSNWFGSTETGIFGSTPSYFGLYVYRINQALPGGDYFNISFSGSGLSKGTIAIGYALSSQHTFSTPWTVAGDVVSAPEPGLKIMLGMSLLCAFGLLRGKPKMV